MPKYFRQCWITENTNPPQRTYIFLEKAYVEAPTSGEALKDLWEKYRNTDYVCAATCVDNCDAAQDLIEGEEHER